MSTLSKRKGLSDANRTPFSIKELPAFLSQWLIRNKLYFLAFAVPVVVMYVAYAIFKVFPFGDNSVLVLDLNGQYVYYFESIRDAFWGDESIFYNWSRNLSGGFAGVIGYYLASPLTLIPILLPRTMILGSLMIMILTKVGLASVTFCYFLRKSRNIAPLQSVVFSVLYALCAYGVIQAMDPMWLDGVYLLPLIALGVEYLIDDGRKLNLIIPLAMIFVFNFYIGYIVGLFTIIYFAFYLFTSGNETRKFSFDYMIKPIGRFILSGIVSLMLAASMILMVYNALALGKFDFTEPDFSFATQFNPLDFFPQLLPAQFDSVDVDGLPEIYSGMLTVLMLPLFYLNGKISIKKKIGFTAVLVLLFLCMYIRPLDMVWHGFQMPNWLPFRYSFTFSFVLVLMGAVSFSKLDGMKPSAIGGAAFCVAAFLAVAVSRQKEYLTNTEIIIAAVFAAIYCIIIAIFRNKEKAMRTAVPIMVLVVCGVELGYNAYNEFVDEDKSLIYSKGGPYYNFINNNRKVVEELNKYNYDHGNENDGFFRADKTYHRTVNDAGALGLRGISHSSSVMNAKLLKFIEALGYSTSTYFSRYDGNTPITDSLLGIKYSIDRQIEGDDNARRLTDQTYEPIFQCQYQDENDKTASIDVFENPNALSLGYMVDGNIKNVGALGNDNTFLSQNIFMSTIAGHTVINTAERTFDSFYEYFKKLDVDPDSFILNSVSESTYGENQRMYTAIEGGDPIVNMHIVPERDGPVYIYFQTENQKKVNLWLSTEKDENGNYINHKFMGEYFENHNYHTLNLGDFKAGEEFELRMTVANEYTIVRSFHFYQFDYDLFKADIDKLKQQQWNITDFDGDYIKGTINAGEGQLMLTSIPYEDGWTIKVDGETLNFVNKDTTEYDVTDQCYTKVVEALYAIKMTPGEHTVEMSYTPPGLIPGLFLFVLGAAASVFIWREDRKNNKVILAAIRAKKGEAVNEPVKPSKNLKKKSVDENEETDLKEEEQAEKTADQEGAEEVSVQILPGQTPKAKTNGGKKHKGKKKGKKKR